MQRLGAVSQPSFTPKRCLGALCDRRRAFVFQTEGFTTCLYRPQDICNGILGSLVSITAPCAVVHSSEAILIGFIGSIFALLTNALILGRGDTQNCYVTECHLALRASRSPWNGTSGAFRSKKAVLQLRIMRLRIDDPVGAIGVHGAGGIWGVLCVGLFADAALPGIEARNAHTQIRSINDKGFYDCKS